MYKIAVEHMDSGMVLNLLKKTKNNFIFLKDLRMDSWC